MKILDLNSKQKLNNISIFLTKEEILQMKSYLDDLIKNPSHQHSHFSSEDYKNEITLWLYEINSIDTLPKKVQEFIKYDKWT